MFLKKRLKSRCSVIDRFVKLSFEQKCLIVQDNFDDLNLENERKKLVYEKKLNLEKVINLIFNYLLKGYE